MSKLESILKFASFLTDSSGNVICTDENILGHYHSSREVGKTKEESAQKMLNRYNEYILSDKPQRRELWELGWQEDLLEPNFEKLRNVYLSHIADSLWLKTQQGLAPIGREYLLRELVPRNVILQLYQSHFPEKSSQDYGEMLKEMRSLQEESSFEFASYTKQDCIREGFFQVYSQRSVDELKLLFKSIHT